jgi:hypothetical protein
VADSKISDLSAVTDVQATDEYVLARAGTSKKIDASDLAAGLGGGLTWDDIQPVGTRVEIYPYWGSSANVNWGVLYSHHTIPDQIFVTLESSGAQNDEITFKVALAAGTWSITWMIFKLVNAGIYTISLDGVSQGTVDGYNSGTQVNQMMTLTGLVATTSGLHDLNFKMATKNASSSGYYGDLQGAIVLWRTA